MEKERRYIKREAEIVSEEGRMIKGYAAVFNSTYDMWEGYSETIATGAFDGCDMSDVVGLFNHDDDFLLARYKDGEGTLSLSVDDKGLAFEFEAPNTTAGNDVLENIRLKNIRGCSFAFMVSEQKIEEFEDGTCLRTILKISKLYDVGPVINPAYEDTEVEACKRSIEAAKPKKPIEVKPSNTYYRKLKLKLSK